MCALQVLEKVVQGALLLIKAYRAREAVDSAPMLSLVRMLRDLGLYATHFQGPFLAASDSAYANDGLVLVGRSSVADALEQAERRLAEEASLCREFLDPSTLEPALEVVKKQLIERHFTAYVTRGLGPLLQESRLKDLARFLRLASMKSPWPSWAVAPFACLYTRIGSNRGNSQSTIMCRKQNIHTHSNGTAAPSRKSFPSHFAILPVCYLFGCQTCSPPHPPPPGLYK